MMPRSKHTIKQWRIAATIATGAVIVASAGCALSESPLLAHHMSDRPRDAAQQRWDNVRSGMKVQLAEQHLNNGRIGEAEDALEQAISLSPENSHAYTLAARLRLCQGKLSEAREMIRLARALPAQDPEIDYLAGVLAERCGELEDALEQYTAAAMQEPNNEEYLIAQVQTMATLGRPVDALELISSREADFDGNVELQLLAARLCRHLGLRGPAVRCFKKAIHLADENAYLKAEFGRTLAWAENHEEAISVLRPLYDATVKKDPFSVIRKFDGNGPMTINTAYHLARVYVETNRPDEARTVLQPVLASAGRNPLLWCLFARAALKAGDLAQAAEALDTLHKSHSGTADTWLLAALIAHEQADVSAVRASASRALGIDPTSEHARMLLASVTDDRSESELYADSRAHPDTVEPSHWETPEKLEIADAARGREITEVQWPFGNTMLAWPQTDDVAMLEVSEGD